MDIHLSLTQIWQVAIPYVALETVSNVVKDQIVRALQQVAECHGDRRQAAACFHLGVCFASNFGVNSNGIVDDARNGSLATQWLGKSAELGDTWGRLAILPVSRALEQRIDDKLPLVQWLHEIAVQGSGIALSQLAKVDKPLYETALRKNRSEFSGNGTNVFANISETSLEPWEPLNDRGDNVLHYAASVGNNNVLASILEQSLLPIDAINFQGDTALICAVRGGHSDTIKLLVDAGASAEISNEYSENPLHFLCQIEDAKAVELGMILLYAGAEMATVAVASSHHWGEFDRLSAVGGGTPLQRAVVFNSPQVLKALFEMEQILVAQGRSRLLPSWTDILTLLECAIKMHHVNLFDTLQDMLRAHLEWDFYPQTLDEVLKSWKVHRLPEVMEWCLRGNVFSNPETGLNWPEKFCRMMMFGSNHRTVLHKALRFLEDSGGSFLEQGCGDDSNAMAFAIRYGRRDSITWMLSKMKGASSDLFWGTVPLEKFIKTSHYPEKMMPWNSPEPQRFVARASSRHPDVPITNHRAKSFLVAVVCFAISHDQREILHDLLNHKDGFALDEGISTQIALAGYDDYHGGKSYTINTSEGPDYTLDAYGLGDARYLFPQPAGNYAVVFPVPKKRRFEGPGFTVMEATLNYSLLYVTLISTSEDRDISLA
jgi:Ankyrin repeats (3 copies)